IHHSVWLSYSRGRKLQRSGLLEFSLAAAAGESRCAGTAGVVVCRALRYRPRRSTAGSTCQTATADSGSGVPSAHPAADPVDSIDLAQPASVAAAGRGGTPAGVADRLDP